MLEQQIARINAKAFPGCEPTLVTPTRSAALGLTRFAPVDVGSGIEITMPAEEAFVIVFQIREHPAHDFWSEGKLTPFESAPRGTLHIIDLTSEPRAQSTTPMDKLIFHPPRAALDEIADDAAAAKVGMLAAPCSWSTFDPVVESFEKLLIDALEGRQANRLLVDHVIRGLHAHFAVTYGGMRPGERLARGGLAAWQEARAKDMLAASLAGDVTLDVVASECGLSPGHFARAFKASTGATPHAWLQERRLDAAKRLLKTSYMPLATVAVASGFGDQSHFTKAFRRAFGMPPGQWRRLQA